MCNHMYLFGDGSLQDKCCDIKRKQRGDAGHYLCIFDDHYITHIECPLCISCESRRYIQ